MYEPCYNFLRPESSSQGLNNLVGNFFDAINNVIGVYGAQAPGFVDWNNTATFDNGYTSVDVTARERYGKTSKTLAILPDGTVLRDWTGAEPSVAFILQVAPQLRTGSALHTGIIVASRALERLQRPACCSPCMKLCVCERESIHANNLWYSANKPRASGRFWFMYKTHFQHRGLHALNDCNLMHVPSEHTKERNRSLQSKKTLSSSRCIQMLS
jgi:hypothetical protein